MLERYLEKIDTKEILERYGVKKLSKSGEWWNGLCPFHHDKNPSFGMNERTKVYNCFVCGGGDFIDFISKIEQVSRTRAIEIAYSLVNNLGLFDEEPEKIKEKLLAIINNFQDDFLPQYDVSVLKDWNYIHPYLIERGITEYRAWAHFRVGFSRWHEMLTFPVFWGENLIGVLGRRTDNRKPKYKPIPGYEFPSSRIFYHFVPEYSRVVVVEGVLDAIKLWSYGVLNVVASFGSNLSDEQTELLTKNFREVVLWFDNDEAGKSGTRKAIKKLIRHVNVFVAEGIRKDPAEHSLREVIEVKKNLKPAGKWLIEQILEEKKVVLTV